MFEEAVNRPSRWRVFWPAVDDPAGAREATEVGSWLVFAAAIVSVGAAVLISLRGGGLGGFVDAAFLGLIGLGIRRGWRSAAVTGLLFQLLGLGMAAGQGTLPGVMGVLCLVGMVNGVRGAYALRRLAKPSPPVSTEASTTG